VLSVVFFGVLWLRGDRIPSEVAGAEPFTIRAIKAIFLIFLELSVLASCVILATLLFGRPGAVVISFAAFTFAHLTGGLAVWLENQGSWFGVLAAALLPKMEFFRVTRAAISGQPNIGAGYLALGAAYAVAGVALFLLLAMIYFKKREVR
jgi:ABC-type transport system involved in multi-copper enzyme maturation permease subunit